MGIIGFIVFGFIIGLIARAIVPGKQSMGLIMTAVLGMVGSVIGGLVSSALFHQEVGGLHGAGFLGSLIGAVVVLLIAMKTMGGRRAAV